MNYSDEEHSSNMFIRIFFNNYLLLDDVIISAVGVGSLPLLRDAPAFVSPTKSHPAPGPPFSTPSGDGELDPGALGMELTSLVLLLLEPSRPGSSVVLCCVVMG